MRNKINVLKVAVLLFLVSGIFIAVQSFAITGPTSAPGVGSGAISVDSSNNLSVGAAGGSQVSGTKFQIIAPGSTSGSFGFRVLDSGGVNPIFSIRSDGKVKIWNAIGLEFSDGTIQTTAVAASATTTPAALISAVGAFGSSTGGGNYSFSAGLTADSPTFVVDAVNHRVGIGTTGPGAKLDIQVASTNGSPTTALRLSEAGTAWAGSGSSIDFYNQDKGAVNLAARVGSWLTGGGANAQSSDLVFYTTAGGSNTEKMRIQSVGNVGIGTTVATSTLTVAGTVQSTSGGFKFPDGTTQTSAVSAGTNYWSLSGTSLYPTSTAYQLGVGTASLDPNYAITTAGGGIKANSGAQPAGYFSSASGYALLTGTGNVGIGTMGPTNRLEVVGPAGVTSFTGTTRLGLLVRGSTGATDYSGIDFNGYYTGGTSNSIARIGTLATGAGSYLQFGTSNSYVSGITNIAMTIDYTGNVGIGTTGPGAKLDIQVASTNGSPTTALRLSEAGTAWAGSGSSIDFYNQDNGAVNLAARIGSWLTGGSANAQSSDLVFYTTASGSNTEKMRITSTGNVGIGTLTSSYKLDVSGVTNINAGALGRTGLGGVMITGTLDHLDPLLKVSEATATGCTGCQRYGVKVSVTGVATSSINYGIYATAANAGTNWAGYFDGNVYDNGTLTATTFSGAGTSLTGTAASLTAGAVPWTGVTGAPAFITASNAAFTAATVTFGGGTGKITVGTVDPPYTIDGEKFATYFSGMTGQKEETTGNVNVSCRPERSEGPPTCSTTIDFNAVEKGSDLWLFSRAANLKENMARLTVLLTPSFDGRVWYEKDAKNLTLTIYGTPSSLSADGYALSSGLSVSYRLTSPRFDSTDFPNTRSDDPAGLKPPSW